MYKLCCLVSMSCLNDLLNVLLIVLLIIFTLVVRYSGINAGEVARLESGGECDSLGFHRYIARLLGNGHQAAQGLDTDVALPSTHLNILQMVAPRAAI